MGASRDDDVNRGVRLSTLLVRELDTGRRIALGRRADEDARVFDPDSGEICEPLIQAATIVDPSWVTGCVIAGHQSGPTERTVAIYCGGQVIDRCTVIDGAWMSAPIALEIGQTLRLEWSNEHSMIVDRVTMPPLDQDNLETPRWHSYGPALDRQTGPWTTSIADDSVPGVACCTRTGAKGQGEYPRQVPSCVRAPRRYQPRRSSHEGNPSLRVDGKRAISGGNGLD